ncbi:hypothetical protein MNBD_GAMMA01-2172 [hydrothermal vent metagenome]|uniref:Glycosyltransferase 2-like domain-containing protein n=1 Tax=hydrothermal vent metagenome TaxID=652676 RepID=A0A3B0VU24_9ZZZZ
MIDVVIPIYNAYEALQNCLSSLAQQQVQAYNIYLINDASTDKRVKPYLQDIAEKNSWHLINHAVNQGFVKTANEGLRLSDSHTILLNSDTIVSKFWLDAFLQAIQNIPQLGTATAWSNNAEICSFPKFLTQNKTPKNINIISEILYKSYKPRYPILPTAVGFCMLVTELAKGKVGYFDAVHFGHGYGEENDYSMRVVAAGLTNILCDNAYVAHIGNQSFNDLGLQPNEKTMYRLLQKHPKYGQMIQTYIDSDPLAEVRTDILSLIKQKNTELYQELISQ